MFVQAKDEIQSTAMISQQYPEICLRSPRTRKVGVMGGWKVYIVIDGFVWFNNTDLQYKASMSIGKERPLSPKKRECFARLLSRQRFSHIKGGCMGLTETCDTTSHVPVLSSERSVA